MNKWNTRGEPGERDETTKRGFCESHTQGKECRREKSTLILILSLTLTLLTRQSPEMPLLLLLCCCS